MSSKGTNKSSCSRLTVEKPTKAFCEKDYGLGISIPHSARKGSGGKRIRTSQAAYSPGPSPGQEECQNSHRENSEGIPNEQIAGVKLRLKNVQKDAQALYIEQEKSRRGAHSD